MKPSSFFVMTLLLLNPMLVPAQNTSNNNTNQENDPRKDIVITGCLTKNSLNEFELVDEKGIDNMPYSDIVNLDQYVGQNITIVGRRSAMPSTDMGIKNPKPHFMVKKIQSQSGQCKK